MKNLKSLFLFTIICLLNSTLSAQWVTVFNDDFNRADGEIGPPWTLIADTLYIQDSTVIGGSYQFGRIMYTASESANSVQLELDFNFSNDTAGRYQFAILSLGGQDTIVYNALIELDSISIHSGGPPTTSINSSYFPFSANTKYKLIFQYMNLDSLVSLYINDSLGVLIDSLHAHGSGGDFNTILLGTENLHTSDTTKWFDNVSLRIKEVTGIDRGEDNKLLPKIIKLYQNYPNPFNPSTRIKYELPKTGKVNIEVFNLFGQRVKILINKYMPAGAYEVEFTANNLPSGVYLYRIKASEFQVIKKMVLLR